MPPLIIHLDMNSYFASVEQQDNPSWRGKPVGVCEHLGGIIIAASIEAKRWGIKTGTPVWEAKKLYPKIILSKTHPNRYRFYTSRFLAVVHDYSAEVEQYSIDEVFLDLTKVCNIRAAGQSLSPEGNVTLVNPFEEAVRIMTEVKRRMKVEVGDWLRCSVGIATNKLLAKIASDLKKPDGVTVILPNEGDPCVPPRQEVAVFSKSQLYTILKLTDIPGIARRQAARLAELGILTLADLRDYPESKLVAQFGILGRHLSQMGQLESSWKPAVEQEAEIKSIGHMYTLPKEYREKKFFVPVLYKLSEMVARRLRRQELEGDVLHFHIHDASHECFGKSKHLGYYMRDGREIFFESMAIFEHVTGKTFLAGMKLIGVTVAGLREETRQQSLFVSDERQKRLVRALDKVNEKYGDFTLCRVPVQQAGRVFHDSIGFGRIREGGS